MIGKTGERAQLQHSIDEAYGESLAADQYKQIELQEQRSRQQHLSALMQQRKERVEEEPSLSDDHVTVLVRHPILGPKGRIFRSNTTFSAVYDWIGSLHTCQNIIS